MPKLRNQHTKKILLLDTGKEWGGGTVSMIDLIQRIDPLKIKIVCCFYYNYSRGNSGKSLSTILQRINISSIFLPKIFESFWIKILKEFVRLFFFFNKKIRKYFLEKIDLKWRVKKRATQLIKVLNSDSYDLVYLNNQPSSNLEAYIAAEYLGIPVIQHTRINVLLSKFEVNVINRIAKTLICNSYGLKNSLLKQGVDQRKISVVYNGFEMPKLTSKATFFKKSSEQIVLGTISSLVKRKSIHHIIDALEICRFKDNLDIHLIIVGDGPEEKKLISHAKNKQVLDYVTFAGFSDDPISWIRHMDIFVFASNREGFGRVIVEAMLCEKPVIAADSIGPNEIVKHGKTGYLYPYGNIKEMATLITKLAKNKKSQNLMGKSGLISAKKRFSMKNYVSGVTKIIEGAIF